MKHCNVIIEEAIWAIIPSARKDMESRQNDGQADFDRQQIRVFQGLPFHEQVETLIHEIMHVQAPDVEEQHIDRRAKEVTRALFKSGLIRRVAQKRT